MARIHRWLPWLTAAAAIAVLAAPALIWSRPRQEAKDAKPSAPSSYDQIAPVLVGEGTFASVMAKDKAAKKAVMARQQRLLDERYDLTKHVSESVKMSGGKPIPVGPATRLPKGVDSWDELSRLSPDELKDKGMFPAGFLPLPHPHHEVGGMLFPPMEIKQLARLERFDLDFDLPEHFLPDFPPPIFLTTRPDLGDVTKGQLVTVENFQQIFAGILNSKDLEGVRLLVTQFPQQQFNATADRKTEKAEGMKGVACFDCHVNGHTSGATHLVGDIRPQNHRRRIDTPSLRGVNIQRLFGSQRALKNVEDFTEFEQRAAYFDGDILSATAKGLNVLERGSQVHFMAEFQDLLAFPPAPNLGWDGKLDPKKFKPDSLEMQGQKLFFGKAQCSTCHPAPWYTDNTMHDLKVERFYKTQTHNGLLATQQGPIKTFPLRGIKDSPPYFHDGRLPTLEDTVEFFNLILELKLNAREKQALVAFMRQLSGYYDVMDLWYRIFAARDTMPVPADLDACLAGAGVPWRVSVAGDAGGWYRADIVVSAGSSLVLERWLADEVGIRAELNSWAAYLETCADSPHSPDLMERTIQARQLFTLRRPAVAGDEEWIERVCLALSRHLATVTEGFYHIDGQGFFTAQGTLLVKEH
jgi:cytochrome c peroxidase